jgi:hypothetical protein
VCDCVLNCRFAIKVHMIQQLRKIIYTNLFSVARNFFEHTTWAWHVARMKE